MVCKECGGEVIFEEFHICLDCGVIQSTASEIATAALSDYSETHQQDRYVKLNKKIDSKAFREFKSRFLSLTYHLNSPVSVINKGDQLLPDLFNLCRHSRHIIKHAYMLALLFYTYESHGGSPISLQTYLQKVPPLSPHINVTKIFNNVKTFFKFPNHCRKELVEINVTQHIKQLSQIILKPDVREEISLGDLEDLANRLAKLIRNKSWHTGVHFSVLSEIEHVSVASVVIAAHCQISLLSRKREHFSRKKRRSFRYETINFEELCKKSAFTLRTLNKWISEVQNHLYHIYKSMPACPGSIKGHKFVGQVLVQILDYLDLEIDDIDPEDFERADKRLILKRNFLLGCLIDFLMKEQEGKGKLIKSEMKDQSCPFPYKKFHEHTKSLVSSSQDFSDCVIHLNAKRNIIYFGEDLIALQHMELMYELFENGASFEELKTEKLSNLTRKYIESKESSSELDFDPEEDDNLNKYIRTREEIKLVSSMGSC
ncbi:uncharacterized protein [Clytia hemisphaerica]